MVYMWTNGDDFVIAHDAEVARQLIMRDSGYYEDDIGTVAEWRKVPEDRVWTLCDEDDPDKVENISICALLSRHVALHGETPLFQWSSSW